MDRDRSIVRRVRRWLFDTGSADSADADRSGFAEALDADVEALDTDAGGDDVLSRVVEENLSPGDVLTELGLTPGEYIEYVLAVADGRLPERRLVELTGWSADTVSRLLARLEAQRRIVRLRDGRRTLVCFPDAAPERAPTA